MKVLLSGMLFYSAFLDRVDMFGWERYDSGVIIVFCFLELVLWVLPVRVGQNGG